MKDRAPLKHTPAGGVAWRLFLLMLGGRVGGHPLGGGAGCCYGCVGVAVAAEGACVHVYLFVCPCVRECSTAAVGEYVCVVGEGQVCGCRSPLSGPMCPLRLPARPPAYVRSCFACYGPQQAAGGLPACAQNGPAHAQSLPPIRQWGILGGRVRPQWALPTQPHDALQARRLCVCVQHVRPLTPLCPARSCVHARTVQARRAAVRARIEQEKEVQRVLAEERAARAGVEPGLPLLRGKRVRGGAPLPSVHTYAPGAEGQASGCMGGRLCVHWACADHAHTCAPASATARQN